MTTEIKPFPGMIRKSEGGRFFFDEKQERWFKDVYPNTSNRILSRMCGLKERTLKSWAFKRGLHKTTEHRSTLRHNLYEEERRRYKIGLRQRTKYMVARYTAVEVVVRRELSKLGYILGDPRERMGERYTIYYDDETERRPMREAWAEGKGFSIIPLPEEEQEREYNYKFQ